MNNEKIPSFSELLSSGDIDSIIKSQIKDVEELNDEIFKVRSYLLDNYGPFGRKEKVLSGVESTLDMVKIIIKRVVGGRQKEFAK